MLNYRPRLSLPLDQIDQKAIKGSEFTDNFSLSVNGIDENVNFGNDVSMRITNNFSACCWIFGAPGQEGKPFFNRYNHSTNNRAWAMRTSRDDSGETSLNRLTVILSDDGTLAAGHSKLYMSSITILDNDWHLVGFTFDSGVLKLYIDGVEDGAVLKVDDDAITTIFAGTSDVVIGSWANDSSYFAGNIDDPQMYSTTILSAADFTNIYNSGCPKDEVSRANLIDYWLTGDSLLDDPVGGTGNIQDVSGDNNGTPANTDNITNFSVNVPCPLNVIATGGDVVTDYNDGVDDWRSHTYLTPGTFSVQAGGDIQALLVGGGGGGGGAYEGGGGGGGEFKEIAATVTAQDYAITIGAGGIANVGNSADGTNGGTSSIAGIDSVIGGGRGGSSGGVTATGAAGGSGGGSGLGPGGIGTAGNDGGSGEAFVGGGGGGANAVGGDADNSGFPDVAGNGGGGLPNTYADGTTQYYAGGGGGGGRQGSTIPGTGGQGGGGDGDNNATGQPGTPSTGGGGGGGGHTGGQGDGGAGAGGLIVIRYKI